MKLAFQVEKWSAFRDELWPVAEVHWREMPFDVELPLALDEPLYANLDAAGRLLILTARDGRKLAGYFLGFVGRHPHYDVLTGSMDVYFLLPEYRRGRNGLLLFKAFEEAMRARSVGYLLATARLDRSPGAARLFEKLGWTSVRTVYQKRLRG